MCTMLVLCHLDNGLLYIRREKEKLREDLSMLSMEFVNHLVDISLKNLLLSNPTFLVYSYRNACGSSDTVSYFVKLMGKPKTRLSRRELQNDRPEHYLQALQDVAPDNIDLVLCILTNSRKDRYDALKKFLCLDNPIPSQVGIVFFVLDNF